MYSDIMGMDEDVSGDELVGNEEMMGDELVGDEEVMGALNEAEVSDYLDFDDDALAGDEYMGEEMSGPEIMGAYPPRRRRPPRRRHRRRHYPASQHARARAFLNRAMLAKRLQSTKLVHNRRPHKSRIQSIGFSRPQVPAGATVEITARPQELFRGTRLIVGSSIAPSFVIEDIKVGRSSQFVATGAQPAEAFRDTATGDNVALDTCRPGQDLTLIVTNTTPAGTPATDFRASLFGDVVE